MADGDYDQITMGCFHPMPAFRTEDGDVVFVERGSIHSSLTLPCGNCVGCRIERARQWTMRIMHEAKMHKEHCFITLTYDDNHIPTNGSLNYPDYQRFMKRLRKKFKTQNKIRFYMCGEYGEKLTRPHYHAGIFGIDFKDRTLFKQSGSGIPVYRSKTLEQLWPHGYSAVGDLTKESAAYMARYIMKKVNGGLAEEHYTRVDIETGETIHLTPEFTRMSLKPGLGGHWYQQWYKDVYPHDRVIIDGREQKPPRYYDNLLKRQNKNEYKLIKDDRETEAGLRTADNTKDRLEVKEQIAKAKLKFYKREL